MKKLYIYPIMISIIMLHTFQINSQNNGLDVLFNWYDESISDQNWVGNAYNEIWGIAQNGHEFAIIGSTQGTHIFDITNPENGNLVAYIEGADASPAIVHRDFHDYNGYLYAVADEGESTLQIIDINNLPGNYELIYDSDDIIKRAHNIFIDPENAMMYVCGGRVNNQWNELALVSLEDPENPILLATYEDVGYVHDIYVIDNIGYLNAGDSGLFIVDFSNVDNPIILGSLTDYPDKGYNHSGWLNSSGDTYIFADENHGYEMKICNVSNPNDIIVNTTFLSNIDVNSMAHNLIIKDDYVYVSHYHDGLWIWDISNPSNPVVVGSYDTYNPDDHDSYRGAWGVYPLLPSGNILVSDMQSGLFVLSPPENQNSNILENSIEVSIFPNPFNEEIIIQMNSNDNFNISIFDIHGKMVLNEKKNTSCKLYPKLDSGVYFLEVNSEKVSYNVKIIRP